MCIYKHREDDCGSYWCSRLEMEGNEWNPAEDICEGDCEFDSDLEEEEQ